MLLTALQGSIGCFRPQRIREARKPRVMNCGLQVGVLLARTVAAPSSLGAPSPALAAQAPSADVGAVILDRLLAAAADVSESWMVREAALRALALLAAPLEPAMAGLDRFDSEPAAHDGPASCSHAVAARAARAVLATPPLLA